MNILALQKFVGKFCTILTQPVNMNFKDIVQHAQYFTGEVTEIDEGGIWLKHPLTKKMSYYTFPIVGIVEEQHIPANDPLVEQLKQEEEKQKQKQKAMPKQPLPVQTPRPAVGRSDFIPIDDLTKMIKKKA